MAQGTWRKDILLIHPQRKEGKKQTRMGKKERGKEAEVSYQGPWGCLCLTLTRSAESPFQISTTTKLAPTPGPIPNSTSSATPWWWSTCNHPCHWRKEKSEKRQDSSQGWFLYQEGGRKTHQSFLGMVEIGERAGTQKDKADGVCRGRAQWETPQVCLSSPAQFSSARLGSG